MGTRFAIGIVYAWVFLFLAAIYYLSFSLKSDATILVDDGIEYARIVESGAPLLHPHHLLYLWLGRVAWNVQRSVTGNQGLRAVESLRLVSALCGSAGVIGIFILLKRVTSRPLLSAAISLWLGFSRGYWFFSSSAETIVPGAAFTLPFFYLLFLIIDQSQIRLWAWLAIATAAAVVVRQDNILLMPVALLCVLFVKGRDRAKGVMLYFAATFAISLALYLASYLLARGGYFSWKEFAGWVTSYAHHEQWCSIGNLGFSGLKTALLRLLHTLGYGTVDHLDRIRAESLTPRICLASRMTNVGMILCGIATVLALVPSLKAIMRRYRIYLYATFSWLLVREIFLTWVVPEAIMAFSVGSLIPIAIILGLAVSEALDEGKRIVAIPVAGLVFCASLSGLLAVIPFSRSTFYKGIDKFDSFSRPGDMVFVREFYQYALLTYYGHRRAAILDYYHDERFRSLDKERIAPMMRETWESGGRVYLMPCSEGAPFNRDKLPIEKGFFERFLLAPIHSDVHRHQEVTAWEVVSPDAHERTIRPAK